MHNSTVAVVQATGFYLSYKDIAVISNSATESKLGDKTTYDTLIRPGFAFQQIGGAAVAVSGVIGDAAVAVSEVIGDAVVAVNRVFMKCYNFY